MSATIKCLKDDVKLSLTKPPEHSTIHVGTNDLVLDKIAKEIEELIFNIVCSLNIKSMILVYELIILKTTDKQLTQKGREISISERAA